VLGTLVPGSAGPDTRYIPALTVTSIDEVPAPSDPYEY
jgi:uncharacterized membrane protein YcgQ (UPF0703/DUF1980 family)